MTKKRTTRTHHGRPGAHPGEDHHFAKITDAEVDEMRAMYAEGLWSYRTLGEKFGVSKSCVRDTVIGRRRHPIGDDVGDLC